MTTYISRPLLRLAAASILICAGCMTTATAQKFRHVQTETLAAEQIAAQADSIAERELTAQEIFDTIVPRQRDIIGYARYLAPNIFSGYRQLRPVNFQTPPLRNVLSGFEIITPAPDTLDLRPALAANLEEEDDGTVVPIALEDTRRALEIDSILQARQREQFERMKADPTPGWLRHAIMSQRIHDDVAYRTMIADPYSIDYAYWDLPEPPRLPDDEQSFRDAIRARNISEATGSQLRGRRLEIERINWLHNAGASIQFSQAFLSPNWYQGGNNSLSLLVNLGWNVTLNPIWHPDVLLSSDLTYKLGLNSTPQDTYHKYSISQDLFQWNFKAGLKAFERWFYSFTAQFKTQLFHQYGKDTPVRTSSFLSPGDLNLGLGMTYSFINKPKTVKFNASIGAVSYNLKTCIDSKVDHAQFNIAQNRKFANEIGSNAELTLEWALRSNIHYKSRLFLFSDYSYFQGDWENTLSFNINRFLSTQIFWHVRYDSSSEPTAPGWGHWMVKEILSFGFAYAFSTKI